MTKKLLTLAAAAIVAFPAGATAVQAQESSWIHVRVDEAEETTVRLNLPASMVTVALDAVRREGFDGARFGGSGQEITIDDLREMWRAMRDAGDAEFVNVQDGDERVRVFREGDRVYVQVDEGETENVRMEMPVEIADVLLGTEADQIDLAETIRELARRGESDLVQIRGPDGNVRVWVDQRSGQDG